MLLPSEVSVDPYAEFLRGNVSSALALAERLDDSGVADVSLIALMLECRLARGELNQALTLGVRLRVERLLHVRAVAVDRGLGLRHLRRLGELERGEGERSLERLAIVGVALRAVRASEQPVDERRVTE